MFKPIRFLLRLFLISMWALTVTKWPTFQTTDTPNGYNEYNRKGITSMDDRTAPIYIKYLIERANRSKIRTNAQNESLSFKSAWRKFGFHLDTKKLFQLNHFVSTIRIHSCGRRKITAINLLIAIVFESIFFFRLSPSASLQSHLFLFTYWIF